MTQPHPLKAFRDTYQPKPLTQEQAAQLVGVTKQMWSHLERGGYASPSLAKKISDLTGVALERLLNFGDSDSVVDPEPETAVHSENAQQKPNVR